MDEKKVWSTPILTEIFGEEADRLLGRSQLSARVFIDFDRIFKKIPGQSKEGK